MRELDKMVEQKEELLEIYYHLVDHYEDMHMPSLVINGREAMARVKAEIKVLKQAKGRITSECPAS